MVHAEKDDSGDGKVSLDEHLGQYFCIHVCGCVCVYLSKCPRTMGASNSNSKFLSLCVGVHMLRLFATSRSRWAHELMVQKDWSLFLEYAGVLYHSVVHLESIVTRESRGLESRRRLAANIGSSSPST